MAHTNVQLVSGNLTTGQASPTFFIDRVNDKIGIGGVPVTSGVEADPATSNVLQVTGNMLATRYHGDGSTLTGIEGSKWALTDDGINRVGNVGIGGDASATAATKLYVHGDIDIQSGSSLRIGGVIPVYSNWASDANGINRTTGNVGIGGVASDTNTLKVHGTVEATGFTGIQTSDVPSLAAGKITSDTFADARIPDLAAGKITSGTFADARIPDLAAGKITSGTFADARIPDLAAGKITSGTFADARIPALSYAALAGSSTQAFSADTLTTNGRVGIGGAISTTTTTTLYVHGDILATGDVTASSDRRLKTDIKHIENALDKVCSLGGYTYVMNDKPSSGLIAQEVLEVLPEVVHGSEETNYSLAYGNIVGLLVEAIKELKEKIG
jgi:hypothetical protein